MSSTPYQHRLYQTGNEYPFAFGLRGEWNGTVLLRGHGISVSAVLRGHVCMFIQMPADTGGVRGLLTNDILVDLWLAHC